MIVYRTIISPTNVITVVFILYIINNINVSTLHWVIYEIPACILHTYQFWQ